MARNAEIRGRGKTWKVWVPDPADTTTTHPVYDVDGVQTGVIKAAGPTGKMVESHHVSASVEEAIEYAAYLGFPDAKVTKLKTKAESLAAARAARHGS